MSRMSVSAVAGSLELTALLAGLLDRSRAKRISITLVFGLTQHLPGVDFAFQILAAVMPDKLMPSAEDR